MSSRARVFLDASCWIAAAGSASGGSSHVLKLANAGRIKIVATRRVLKEAENNIRLKLGKEALLRFYRELGTLDLEVIDQPTLDDELRWRAIVDEKDCHVLAGANIGRADVLLTLDRKHILTTRVKGQFPLPVKDPGGFLKEMIEEK